MPSTERPERQPRQITEDVPTLISRLEAALPGAVSSDQLEAMARRVEILHPDQQVDALLALVSHELAVGPVVVARLVGLSPGWTTRAIRRGRQSLEDSRGRAPR